MSKKGIDENERKIGLLAYKFEKNEQSNYNQWESKILNKYYDVIMDDYNPFKQMDNDNWGYFKRDIGPRRYKNLTEAMARVNLSTIDAKVSIDLKRILRLPSSLHSKVSMKCMEVKNRETFDPLQEAVPKFVEERGE